MNTALPLLAALLLAAGAAAELDQVTCARPFADLSTGDVCAGVPQGLADAGFIAEAYQEPLDNKLRIVPPPSVAPPHELQTQWVFASDGGDFEFCFGFCLATAFSDAGQDELYNRVSDGGAAVTDLDQREFAKTCIGASTLIFDDSSEDPVLNKNVSLTVTESLGEEVIFFLVPDERAGAFIADPDTFWADEDRRRPLFSVNGANPGQLAQLVLFHNHTTDVSEGECPCDDTTRTAFMWEDKTRSDRHSPDNSDSDFGDLVFIYQGLVKGASTDFFCDPADPTSRCTEATKSSPPNVRRVTMSWGVTGQRCD